MIDTQEQAHDWLLQAQICAQRAKSVVSEMLGDDAELIARDLNPGLYPTKGGVDIVSMCDRYMDKTEINRTDIMTAMTYINRVGPAILIQFPIRQVFFPDDIMEWFRNSKLPIM